MVLDPATAAAAAAATALAAAGSSSSSSSSSSLYSVSTVPIQYASIARHESKSLLAIILTAEGDEGIIDQQCTHRDLTPHRQHQTTAHHAH
jgi:hypothetical protein